MVEALGGALYSRNDQTRTKMQKTRNKSRSMTSSPARKSSIDIVSTRLEGLVNLAIAAATCIYNLFIPSFAPANAQGQRSRELGTVAVWRPRGATSRSPKRVGKRGSTVSFMRPSEDQNSDPLAPEASAPGSADHARWFALLHSELRLLAQSQLEGERASHTLSATALVHEVYVKLSKNDGTAQSEFHSIAPPRDRGVFFGLAAQAMRRILVDHARTRGRTKRGGGMKIEGGDVLNDVQTERAGSPSDAHLDPIDLDAALTKLAIEHEQAARVVELRFFAGLPEKIIAEVMGINERTVRRHWTFAKAWLAREMNPSGHGRAGSKIS